MIIIMLCNHIFSTHIKFKYNTALPNIGRTEMMNSRFPFLRRAVVLHQADDRVYTKIVDMKTTFLANIYFYKLLQN